MRHGCGLWDPTTQKNRSYRRFSIAQIKTFCFESGLQGIDYFPQIVTHFRVLPD